MAYHVCLILDHPLHHSIPLLPHHHPLGLALRADPLRSLSALTVFRPMTSLVYPQAHLILCTPVRSVRTFRLPHLFFRSIQKLLLYLSSISMSRNRYHPEASSSDCRLPYCSLDICQGRWLFCNCQQFWCRL